MANPAFNSGANEAQPGFLKRHGNKFLVFGMVAVAGVLGYVAGNSVSTTESSGESTVSTLSQDSYSQAMTVLEGAYADPQNEAFAQSMNRTVLNEQVDAYVANPAAWDDRFLTKEIMNAFVTLRSSEDTPLQGRRLLNYQELIGSFPQSTVSSVWSQIENANYAGQVVFENDAALVKRVGSTCYIIAQETNEAGDWWDNLSTGSTAIMSSKKKTVADSSCGCKKSAWYGCAQYKSCSAYYALGNGFKGFTLTYNAMRLALWNKINSVCSSSDTKIFGGYSRGGGIMNIMAYAMHKEGLISSMKLVTFGSPRALGKSESDAVHGKFEQYRMIYKKDPVPSLPYGWMGVKHYGAMRCNQCGYDEARDAPGWGWPTDAKDHTSYNNWF